MLEIQVVGKIDSLTGEICSWRLFHKGEKDCFGTVEYHPGMDGRISVSLHLQEGAIRRLDNKELTQLWEYLGGSLQGVGAPRMPA